MATPKTTPAAAPAAAVTPSRAYLKVVTDEESGEMTEVSRFRYLHGHPRQIRFDAKKGEFNINGITPIGGTLSFIPMAIHIFSDDILNMGRKIWAELYFTDEKDNVCAVLFHGYSVENLKKLNSSLFYDDLNLTDVMLTVTAAEKQTEKPDEKGKMRKANYFIAEFSYTAAAANEVQARQEFAYDFPLYREETITGNAETQIKQGYRIPEGFEPPRQAQLSGGTE